MGHIILHHKGCYNIYSTVVDNCLYEKALTLEGLKGIIEFKDGSKGLNRLPQRLERAHKKGSSDIDENQDLEASIICNRAGENEKHLSYKKFIKKYLTLEHKNENSKIN